MAEKVTIRWAAVAASTTWLALAVAQFVDFGVYDLRVGWLNSNSHASLFGVISILALLAAAGLALVVAALPTTHNRWFLCLPVLLMVLLALRLVRPPHFLIVGLPFAAASVVILWRAGSPGSDVRRIIRWGCTALFVSYALHFSGAGFLSMPGFGPDSWSDQIKGVVQHGGELVGWALVAAGLADVSLAARTRGDVGGDAGSAPAQLAHRGVPAREAASRAGSR